MGHLSLSDPTSHPPPRSRQEGLTHLYRASTAQVPTSPTWSCSFSAPNPGWNRQGTGRVRADRLSDSGLWPGSPRSPCSSAPVLLCQPGPTCPTLSIDWQVSSPMGRGVHSTHATQGPSKSHPCCSLEPASHLPAFSLLRRGAKSWASH